MGLTISYKVKTLKKTENIVKALEIVRQQCLDMSFSEVSEVEHLVYKPSDIAFFHSQQTKSMYPNNSMDNLRKRNKAIYNRGLNLDVLIDLSLTYKFSLTQSYEVIRFSVWAGEGCENTGLQFIRPLGSNKTFECGGFTKTQYAEDFLRCHVLVVKFFDLLKEQGFQIKIKDDGKYWETRDVTGLVNELNSYNGLIQSFGMHIKNSIIESGNTNIEMYSPIDNSKNIVDVDEIIKVDKQK